MAQPKLTPQWYPSFIEKFMDKDMRNWMQAFGGEVTVPAVNVRENDNEFLVEVAAPGMKKDDFDIELEENTLIISCEHREEKQEEKSDYTRREFNYQSFHRTFNIPHHVIDRNNIDAKYVDGILKIHLPKTPEARTKPHRKIKVN